MDIENLKGLPILKAHFKKLANTSEAAYADLNLPDNTVGVVYWKEEDSWVVWNYLLKDSIRAIKSETKDRGYKIDALYFADKFEAKNYNGGIRKLLHVAVEAYANPENKTGRQARTSDTPVVQQARAGRRHLQNALADRNLLQVPEVKGVQRRGHPSRRHREDREAVRRPHHRLPLGLSRRHRLGPTEDNQDPQQRTQGHIILQIRTRCHIICIAKH